MDAVADKELKGRIEQCGIEILGVIDKYSQKGMTVAEIVGVLEFAKTECINKVMEG